jgi:type II secretory pathway pseudopilin PulG
MTNTLDPGPDRAPTATEPRRESASDRRTTWVVLGLVAVVAIVALVYVFSQNDMATQQAALDQVQARQQALDSAGAANGAATSASQAAAGAAAANAAANQAARSAPVGQDQAGRPDQPANPAPPADSASQGQSSPSPGQ